MTYTKTISSISCDKLDEKIKKEVDVINESDLAVTDIKFNTCSFIDEHGDSCVLYSVILITEVIKNIDEVVRWIQLILCGQRNTDLPN